MASGSSTSAAGEVPPGFRFHPTDEELLLYYLKKKISLEKFELEVIREIDLNKIEPWDLQERCRIGSTPQNEWYFFRHKDRKYPTGSRTNRATGAGFWKATGRDKCIRVSYGKIGMRKTLVFYRGRAPHGQKTDWIMHEYRLDYTEFPADHHNHDASGCEDGWVVCRVFKKKCFFKLGSGGRGSEGSEIHSDHIVAVGHEQKRAFISSHFMHPSLGSHYHHRRRHHLNPSLYYPHLPPTSYAPHGQVLQDLLTNHRPSGYELGVLPADSAAAAAAATASGIESAGMQVDPSQKGWTTVLEGMEGRLGGASAAQGQMNEMANLHGGDMELWGYGK